MLILLCKIVVAIAVIVFAVRTFIRLWPWLAGILAALGMLIKLYLASLQSKGDEPPPSAQPVA